jgi:hypothetical protein
LRIFSHDLTFFIYRAPYWEKYVSAAFTPISSDVTLKVQYKCTALGQADYSIIYIDDLTLAPV